MWLEIYCQNKCEIKNELVCHCCVGCHFAETMQDEAFNLSSYIKLTKCIGTA